ncbi:hypothetical protein HPB50_009862 [Hyalomma asiaticum]|uniref:Uncharacterized protein n=1 Tax=Hyalomma asiaticum TaxID=266040 RepID=A0ACB7RVT1_HYAAI|nr:hypothetical protein HPB50_009862 [Hyalomma asiaticum]
MRESLEFMNVAFEGFKNDIANFRRELTEAKTQNKEIVKQNQEMSRQLADPKKEIFELKQHGRNMNVEIMGLPRTADENLKATVGIMATCLGIELSDGDIDVAHRVPSRDKDKSNVVRFASRTSRDKFLNAAKKTRLNTSRLSLEHNDPMYVNEHLCLENKILFRKAREVKAETKWKFAWISQGRILMRKAENSTVVHIQSEGGAGPTSDGDCASGSGTVISGEDAAGTCSREPVVLRTATVRLRVSGRGERERERLSPHYGQN